MRKALSCYNMKIPLRAKRGPWRKFVFSISFLWVRFIIIMWLDIQKIEEHESSCPCYDSACVSCLIKNPSHLCKTTWAVPLRQAKFCEVMTLYESCAVEPIQSVFASQPGRDRLNPDVRVEGFYRLHPITKSLTSLQPFYLQNPARMNRRASLDLSRSAKLTNLTQVHINIPPYLFPCCSPTVTL